MRRMSWKEKRQRKARSRVDKGTRRQESWITLCGLSSLVAQALQAWDRGPPWDLRASAPGCCISAQVARPEAEAPGTRLLAASPGLKAWATKTERPIRLD